MKGGTSQMTTGDTTKAHKNVPTHQSKAQPTAEQIRAAKLAQFSGQEMSKLQEKIKEVSDVTGKPIDAVSIALHESNYDVAQAIQNIIDGQYDCVDAEWQTKPSKKRKPQSAAPATTGERTIDEDDIIENHVNEEDDEKLSSKLSRSQRGGKRGGRPRRPDDKLDEKPAEPSTFKEKESISDETGDRIRSGDRGRGRARGRGRGGAQRGGSRKGGFGRGGSSFGAGRGGQRGRGRGFARRPKQEREQKLSANEGSSENIANEKESWDFFDINDDADRETDWALAVEAETGKEDWADSQWAPSVSEDNTASLFSMSMLPSSTQSESWSHANGPDSSWGRTSPSRQQPPEESVYRPENVDTAVIKSQRAEPSSKQESYTTSELSNRPTYTSSLHSSQFPAGHPTSSITSSILGRNYNLESLAKASSHGGASDTSDRSTATTMISGVHDSHKLEQEQIQPVKVQRQPKPKKSGRSQLPTQPVEMPKSFMEEIEQQLGGLEFGSGPSLSPKFGSESTSTFGVTAVSTVFQDSSPPNITSTIHAEAVRHSVAVPETSTNLSEVSVIPSTISEKADRPKTPPGLKSLHDHQSPGRNFAAPTSRVIDRILQMSDSKEFTPVARSSVQSLPATTPISVSNESLQTTLNNTYTGTRSAMNHDVVADQDTVVANVVNDQRSLSSQAMMGLGTASLKNHLQPSQAGSAFASVTDTYGSQNAQNTSPEMIQSAQSASFSKPSVSPVPGSNSQVTYTSAPLASNVLGYQSAMSSATTQTSIRTPATSNKTTVSGLHGMMPMNMFAGMQQGMVLPPYTTYSYGDMVVPRMPVANYYDMMYQNPAQNRESPGSSYQAGDSKFGRDASSPVASSINTGNIHAAHAQQFLGAAAAAAPMPPYGYAYYSHNVIPGTFPVFTNPPTQLQAGKGNMVGAHYQSGYTSPHSSHAYNSGGSQEFSKGAFHQTASQSLQHTKANQGTGSLGGASLSTDNPHHSGYKSQFNQDTKGYQLNATSPSLGMPIQHAQNHMTNYTQYMMQQHHTQLMHQATGHLSHQQLESSSQGSHSITGSQQPKRDTKGQPYRQSSIWSATN